jgi:hypothetical protein
MAQSLLINISDDGPRWTTYSTQEYGQSGIFSNLLGDDVSIGYIQLQ